ncbi:MAG: Ribose-5-phosphate isomerase [Candidatus Parcubacteria bacterium]|jgi:ribose 5-phosphate isomerase B
MNISKIYIGSDHRGFNLKQNIIQFLQSQNIEVVDCGNSVYDPEDDYPDYASEVARKVVCDEKSLGIVVCGTGVGVSIVVNKIPGARSAVLDKIETVAIARSHNHINVLALSSAIDVNLIPDIVGTFIETEPSHQDRHIRRLSKIADLETQI